MTVWAHPDTEVRTARTEKALMFMEIGTGTHAGSAYLVNIAQLPRIENEPLGSRVLVRKRRTGEFRRFGNLLIEGDTVDDEVLIVVINPRAGGGSPYMAMIRPA